MAFGQLQHRERLPFDRFRNRENLPERTAGRADDLSGEPHAFGLQPGDRLFNIFHPYGDIVKDPVPELRHPPWDHARLSTIVGIGLIDKERGGATVIAMASVAVRLDLKKHLGIAN